jgi:LPXTG-motif cell wall-anchored protein
MPQPPSTTNVEPASTSEPDSGSNAWIAGAVIGPILGLALVGFGVWFFLRRRKKAALAPQQGTASMAPIDPSQPPVGVGGHTDAKPQFAPAQPTYYNHLGQPDPYAQQGYPEQGGFSPPQGSPAPQYGFQQSAYNATAALLPPGTHSQYAKYEGGTAELGGDSTGVAPAAPGSVQQNLAPTSQAAELSGVDTQSHGEVLLGGKQQ